MAVTRKLIAAGLILASCGGSHVVYSKDRESPKSESGRHINDDQGGTDQPPPFIPSVQGQDKTSDSQYRTQRAERRQDDELAAQQAGASAAIRTAVASERSALISALGSLFGVISVALLAWTLWYTRKTANAATTSASAAEDAARAAMDSVEIAKLALSHSQASFELSRRPLIAFETFNIGFADSITGRESDGKTVHIGKGCMIQGILKNYGASPSVNTLINIHLLRLAPNIQPTLPNVTPGSLSSVPQGATRGTGTQMFSSGDWDKAFDQSQAFYAVGIVEYEDGFTGKKHRTTTCLSV